MSEMSETERIAILLQMEKDQFEKSARTAAAAVDRLERKFDPLAAAEKRLETQQKRLTSALEKGTITADRHKRGMELLQREFDQTKTRIERQTTAVRDMNVVQADATGFFQRNQSALQQLGYQTGDFAVQVQGGTSAVTAFTQQGSQMLGVLGPMGAIMGAALAIGVPLAASFFSAAESAEEAEDGVDAFRSALDDYMRYADTAQRSTSDLRKEFGDFADEVKKNAEYMMSVAASRAQRLFSGALDTHKAGFREAIADLTEYREALQALERQQKLQAQGMATSEQVLQFEEAMLAARDGADESAEALGLVREQVERIDEALKAAAAAEDFEEIGVKANEALAILQEYYPAGSRMPPLIEEMSAKLDDVVAVTGRAVEETRELADETERAARASRSFGDYGSLAGMRRGRQSRASNDRILSYIEAADSGILDLIATAEGTDRPGRRNYNETLGYGKFTGGNVDLVNMTLREVLDLQRRMLAHPDNNFNSSAVGRYQIVGSTLGGKNFDGSGGLIRNLGLSMDERFTPELQDRLALELIREKGRSPQGIRDTWEGIKDAGISDDLLTRAMGSNPIAGIDPVVEKRNEEAAQEAERKSQEQARDAKRLLEQEIRERKRLAEIRTKFTEESARLAAAQELEVTLIGKSVAEQARLRTEFELTNKAKQDGIDLTERVAGTEQTYADLIRQTAAAVGDAAGQEDRLNKARERAEEKAEFMVQVQGDLKNGLLDAIVAGDSFADTLGNVAQMLARAAMQAALFGDGPFGGGGGGLLGAVWSGISGARAAGGPVAGGRSYLVGEEGPEIFTPNTMGSIIPNHRIGGSEGAGGVADVRVFVDQDGNWQAAVERISDRRVGAATPRIQSGAVAATAKQMRTQPKKRFGL